jgi:hypothetical protein
MFKFKPFAVLAVSLGLIGTALVGGAAPAAASSGCVSKHEFKKVERHMSRGRVAGIFDTDGKLSFRSGQYMSRDYKTCARYAFVTVDYRHGDVKHKTGFWA